MEEEEIGDAERFPPVIELVGSGQVSIDTGQNYRSCPKNGAASNRACDGCVAHGWKQNACHYPFFLVYSVKVLCPKLCLLVILLFLCRGAIATDTIGTGDAATTNDISDAITVTCSFNPAARAQVWCPLLCMLMSVNM